MSVPLAWSRPYSSASNCRWAPFSQKGRMVRSPQDRRRRIAYSARRRTRGVGDAPKPKSADGANVSLLHSTEHSLGGTNVLKHLQAREDWDNKSLSAKGFTLIELLVVIVIL